MNVVVDTNVIVSAIFWPGESRLCMVLWAKRRFHLAITVEIYDEYTDVSQRIATKFPQVNPQPWLKWIERKARVYMSRLRLANNAVVTRRTIRFWHALLRVTQR